MYLKTIEVQGFKSFAHKMTFEFHNGITAIVGPNGSGKSNVADAVRWVLGEQSAKQLRGGNMQDVIFAGTELRRPLSFASVAITLDNTDHALPISYEEVTVTRRLYRSGESEYLLNGTNVRLRDINELFYDTGIGKEGYSIIGQGRIDQIISGKAEERRELFDEAAGIVKFKRRKNTALKKLDTERQNLLRVSDILKELSSRVEPLRLQSEKARQYLELKGKQKELDVNLYLIEQDRVDGQAAAIDEKIATVRSDTESKKAEFDATKEAYDAAMQRLEEMDAEISSIRGRQEESALLLEQLRGRREVIREQLRSMEKEAQRGDERKAYLAEEIARRDAAIAENESSREALLTSLKEAEEKIADEETAYEAVSRKLSDAQTTLDAVKGEMITLLNSRAGVRGRMQRYDTLQEQIDLRKSTIARTEIELADGEADAARAVEEATARKAEAEENLKVLSARVTSEETEVRNLRTKIAEGSSKIEQMSEGYHAHASRLTTIRGIAERYEGYGNAIQSVMQKRDEEPGICGVVADLIKVEKAYEVAIETALGGSIRNIVTDSQETARRMIAYLKNAKAGRATFLPLDALKANKRGYDEKVLSEEGVIDLASRLVSVDKAYKVLPDYLLGRTYVVDTIEHAITISNKYKQSLYLVTLEGDSISPGGSMTGGAFKNRENLLSRRREIEELTETTRKERRAIEDLRRTVDEMRSKRDALREAAAEDSELLREETIAVNRIQLEIEQAKERAASLEKQRSDLAREKDVLTKQIQDVRAESAQVQSELDSSKEQEEALTKQSDTLAEEIEQLRAAQEESGSVLEKSRLAAAQLSEKIHFADETLRRVKWERKSLEAEAETLSGDISENSAGIAERTEELEKTEREIRVKNASVEENRSEEEALAEEKQRVRETYKGFFEKRDALSEELNRLDKENFRLEAQREKIFESIESQTAYIWDEYGLTPSEAKKERREEHTSFTAVKKELGSVRSAIRALGDVNVNAIEEYKETSERYEFLRTQHEDLVKSEESLLKIIKELDTGMRRQFETSFAEINREFDTVFKELFGGGSGTLVLEEGVDVLEAGIAIISQPPGKKLQNMMQLSGGEKSLTAIALLFAIQNLKPSPFCLLDEIEAALDEANVNRFTRYLRKLTDNTQFIVITHRRGTMAAADRLYGITMQEKGVSALVSVNLVKEELDD